MLQENTKHFTMSISYMEIYNEIAIDLLTKRSSLHGVLDATSRVTILEGTKGILHFKNLNIKHVGNVKEALKLLLIGETNRTTAETISNVCSSRSHCIFTIYLKTQDNAKLKSSKMNIIDLAGSERVSKYNLKGTLLKEAKHINLSLHYLEHVILSLCRNQKHVPYRNCIMTYLLKDSLTGNCVTVMLATLNLDVSAFSETISTCKFAQRVSQICTKGYAQEVLDPKLQIQYLKEIIAQLEEKLESKESEHLNGKKEYPKMTKEDKDIWKTKVETYLTNEDKTFEVELNPELIQFCFQYMKQEMISLKKSQYDTQLINEEPLNKNVRHNSVSLLMDLENQENDVYTENSKETTKSLSSLETIPKTLYNHHNGIRVSDIKHELFKEFLDTTGQNSDVSKYIKALDLKYDMARISSETILQCQKNIKGIKMSWANAKTPEAKKDIEKLLEQQKGVYKETLSLLEEVRGQTEFIQVNLNKEKIKLLKSFKEWILNNKPMKTNEIKKVEREYNEIQKQAINDNVKIKMEKHESNKKNNERHIENGKTEKNGNSRISMGIKEIMKKKSINGYEVRATKENINLGLARVIKDDNQKLTDCSGDNERPKTTEPLKSSIESKGSHIANNIETEIEKCAKTLKPSNANLTPESLKSSIESKGSNHKIIGNNIEAEIEKCDDTSKPSYVNVTSKSSKSSIESKGSSHKIIDNNNGGEIEKRDETLKSSHSNENVKSDNNENVDKTNVQQDSTENSQGLSEDIFNEGDSEEFKKYIKSTSLTGNLEMDKEIVSFYRERFSS
ncbi:kinesin-like protein KIF6 isoform X2 [Aethina tumida]|nr:kinesin-like protein KIF6 isoform X2 [Aethina tumida]